MNISAPDRWRFDLQRQPGPGRAAGSGVIPSQALASNRATAGGGIASTSRRPQAHCRHGPQRQSGGRRLRAGAGHPRRRRHLTGPRSFGVVTGCTVNNNVAQAAPRAGMAGADGGSGGIDLAAGSVVTVNNTVAIQNQAIGGIGAPAPKAAPAWAAASTSAPASSFSAPPTIAR